MDLVLTLDTGSYLGTITKKIPFAFENPGFGKAVEELDETKKLKQAFPNATVAEIYQEAALPQFGIPSYDGARDVYFGDGRGQNFGGSCQNQGTGLSYGHDLRHELHLGGEARRALVKYDLSFLPETAKIQKALLLLHVMEFNPKAELNGNAYVLKRRWHETSVDAMGSFNFHSEANSISKAKFPVGSIEAWEKPMFAGDADRMQEPVAAMTFSKKGWESIDITPAAQGWVSKAAENHGLALEMVAKVVRYGCKDVVIRASDYPVDISVHPRLVLAIEGDFRPVPAAVREQNADLKAAQEKAATEKKPLLIHAMSAGSLASRAWEAKVLSIPEVKAYVEKGFIDVRLDFDKPGNKELLRKYGIKRAPSLLALPCGEEGAETFDLVEPYAWDTPAGAMLSSFEFEQTYTAELARILNDLKTRGGKMRFKVGEVNGPSGSGCK